MITKEEILQIVADYYNVDKKDLLTHRRLGSLIEPRFVAMYFMRDNLTLKDIGDTFSRTYQLVIYGVRWVEQQMQFNRDLKKRVKELAKFLNR